MSLQITEETTFLLDMVNAAFGPELNTLSNAIADPAGTEADATTGWVSFGLDGTGANVFESQSGVVDVGTYAFHTDADDTPTASANISLDLNGAPFSLINGDNVRIEYRVRHIGSGGRWDSYLAASTSGVTNIVVIIQPAETAFKDVSIEFIHDAGHRYLTFKESSVGNDGGVYVDNLSVRRIL